MKRITFFITLLVFFTACGGGGGGSSDGTANPQGNTTTADCNGVTTDENSCYLGYIGLSANDKACCDAWIATQK